MGAGRVAVARDLRRERVQRGERRLVAQLLHELDGEPGAVEVAGEIEEERLESFRAAGSQGRVASEARHSLESASCRKRTFYRKDPGERRAGTCEAHVRRGKTESAAALRPVQHASANRIRIAEEPGGIGEAGGREGLAHARARH